MKIGLEMNGVRHVQMFDGLSGIVRGFGQLLASQNPLALVELDERMKAGAVVRMVFTIGSAGPLALVLHGVRADGSFFELLTIDAPPSAKPFRFDG